MASRADADPWDDAKIREAFIYDGGESEYHDPINGASSNRLTMGSIFDRWLKARDERIRAEVAEEIVREGR